ncbi:MAG: hypothetical protein GTN74_03780 [Proteobacteria bacterium]|nr:hypothetical protein [Pseudomonadota bacterium]NIS68404.1 hypothetical protein [Pseudomonadota bacterium]
MILTGMQQILSGLQELQVLIFGLSLIVFMIFMPNGISGMLELLWKRFQEPKEVTMTA